MAEQRCISCGMPLRDTGESADVSTTKPHCDHCSRPDGTLKSYEEVLDGMTGFIVRSQGLNADVARNLATEMMANLPAWSER